MADKPEPAKPELKKSEPPKPDPARQAEARLKRHVTRAVNELGATVKRELAKMQREIDVVHDELRVRDLDEERAEGLRLEDRLRRKQPRRVSWPLLLPILGNLGLTPRKVPPAFWSLDGTAAVVSCPCGYMPTAEVLVMTECQCDRYLFFDGRDVWAFNSPHEETHPADESAESTPGSE